MIFIASIIIELPTNVMNAQNAKIIVVYTRNHVCEAVFTIATNKVPIPKNKCQHQIVNSNTQQYKCGLNCLAFNDYHTRSFPFGA